MVIMVIDPAKTGIERINNKEVIKIDHKNKEKDKNIKS